SASGMLLEMARLDVSSNNIASAGAAGFKRDVTVVNSFPEMLIYRSRQPVFLGASVERRLGAIGTGAVISESVPDMTRGSPKNTGNPLDVAIAGEGFLVVDTAGGERYTRNGNLSLDSEGILVTAGGDPVLGESGEISLGGAGPVEIGRDGTVYQDGEAVDRLRVVRFAEPLRLARQSTTLFAASEDSGPAEEMDERSILPGSLEASNVNPVSEMVNMISVMRAYEASQKLLQSQDQTLEKAVTEIGRL
ncbi:MAG: flagellar basal-body rod protein FlgF, partial [Bacillota bacterium]